jgi:branched-chain amino acid transport system substrate-binding protein
VSRIAAAGTEVLFIGGSTPEAAIMAKGLKARGAAVTIVSGDALLTGDYADLAGAATEGTLVAYPADPRNRPAAAQLVAAFRAKGIDPLGHTLPAYAAVQAWAAAAKAAGGTGFAKVVDALHAGPFNTAIGSVSFDSNGDMMAPAYEWYVWRAGDYAPAGF